MKAIHPGARVRILAGWKKNTTARVLAIHHPVAELIAWNGERFTIRTKNIEYVGERHEWTEVKARCLYQQWCAKGRGLRTNLDTKHPATLRGETYPGSLGGAGA